MIFDVAVIGAGPIGSYTAYQLTKIGLQVLLLEEHSVVGQPINCAGVIGIDAFKDFDLPVKSIQSEIRDIKFISPSGHSLTLSKDSTWAYVVDRKRFDRGLAELATDAGAVLMLNSHVKDIKITDENAELIVGRCNSPTISENLYAKICILATGSLSTLPFRLGLGRPGYYLKALWGEVHTEVKNAGQVEIYVGQEIGGGTFTWIIPLDGNRVRLGVCTRKTPSSCLDAFEKAHPETQRFNLSKIKLKQGLIPIGLSPRIFYKRLLSVGDSAGQVKPTTGGGIYYGLLSSQELVMSLKQSYSRGEFNYGILKNYEKRVRRRIGREVKIGCYFREIVEQMNDQQWDDLIVCCKDEKLLAAIHKKSQFDRQTRVIAYILRQPDLKGIFSHYLQSKIAQL